MEYSFEREGDSSILQYYLLCFMYKQILYDMILHENEDSFKALSGPTFSLKVHFLVHSRWAHIPVLLNFPLSSSQRTALLDDFSLSELLMNSQVTGHRVFVGSQRMRSSVSALSIIFPCAIHKGSNCPSASYSQVLLK